MPEQRSVCITTADGQTGFLIAELLLTHPTFKESISSVAALVLHSSSAKAKELTKLGAKVVPHKPGRAREMANTLKQTGADTICLIPPAHKEKFEVTQELVAATRKAEIPNVLFISSVGCDYADPQKQPRLREFVDLEALVLSNKGDPNTKAGYSPCVIRAGFYAENLLLYAPNAQKDGLLPLPVDDHNMFAPVALGDISQLAARVLTSFGPQGLGDDVRGQLLVATGPTLLSGPMLAENASKALGLDISFEEISEAEAKRVLHTQAPHHDESEKQYLLEYYALVREGKTNYISTTAFRQVTGEAPMQPEEFFKVYAEEFKPKDGPAAKKRKVDEEA